MEDKINIQGKYCYIVPADLFSKSKQEKKSQQEKMLGL